MEKAAPPSPPWVIIPCFNEERTVGPLVRKFREVLPGCSVAVVDNGSTDATARLAEEAGALVLIEKRRGKGHAVRRALGELSGDVAVLVDGDGTYLPEEAPKLLQPVLDGQADMTVGCRLRAPRPGSLSALHRLGNFLITRAFNFSFGSRCEDVLSGYRAFRLAAVKGLLLFSSGFEIEIELGVQALRNGLTVREIPISYWPRPEGSKSKLRPFHDGYLIFLTMAVLLRDLHPLFTMCVAAGATGAAGLLLAACLFWKGMGAAALAALLIFLMTAFLLLSTGITLNAINSRFSQLRDILAQGKPKQ